MTTLLTIPEIVLAYHDRGWFVFPCRGPAYGASPRDYKRPLVRWREDFPNGTMREQVVDWWTKWPDAWIGCALGRISDLIRVDVDGPEAAEKLKELGGTTPTLEFRTPSGGHGYLYKYCPGLKTKQLWKGAGDHAELRIQSDGAYTVIPTAGGYEWLNAMEPTRVPEWIRDIAVSNALVLLEKELYPNLRPYVREIDANEIEQALEFIKNDSDDRETWYRVGAALHNSEFPFELWDNWSRNSPKYKEGECAKMWARFERKPGNINSRSIMFLAIQRGWIPATKFEHLDDTSSAKVLARHVSGRIKHCNSLGWVSWDGTRWSNDIEVGDKMLIEQQIQQLDLRKADTVRGINELKLGGDKGNVDDYKAALKGKMGFLRELAINSSHHKMEGVRYIVRSNPLVDCSALDFDKNPMILNCSNGTLDLETLGLHDHNPEDMIMRVAPTAYDPSTTCPRWSQFIEEIFEDKEVSEWMQKLLGYSITGLTDLHIMPILWGNGRNGKSTMIDTLRAVLGPDYVGFTPSHFFAQSQNEQHPTKLMTLFGRRIMVDSESGDGMKLDEALIKTLTGDATVKARKMFKDFVEFTPTHKLFLMTNHEPKVRGTDDAIWGRILKIPFTQCFLGREDFKLIAKMSQERAGILAWLVEGCRRWQREGLKPYPAAVRTATEEYRDSENVYQQFFAERLVKDEAAVTPKAKVTDSYNQWCDSRRAGRGSARGFGLELKRWFGGDSDSLTKPGNPNYFGIKLM
jgi:putative DNA primase/helicase